MRVLTFLHSFEPGGVERVALRLVKRWRAMGVDAPLFVGRAVGPLRAELATDLAFASQPQPLFGTAWWETLWMILMLPAHIRRVSPDVLFCAGNTYTVVAVAMKLILGDECPPIIAKISNDLERRDMPRAFRLFWYLWLKIQARFIDRWVAMDRSMLKDVERRIGAVECAVIADPALDRLPLAARLRSTQANTRYVSVGRLVPQKDHAAMLGAFADVAGSGDHLTIYGDGPLRAKLMRKARSLGIVDQIAFAGHVPDAAALLREHDVFLLTSRYEGIPAVLIEALAAGLRIVATRSSAGVQALCGDGRLGALVEVGDRAALGAAIATALHGDHDVLSARRQAQRFTLDAAAPLYVDAFARTVRAATFTVRTAPVTELRRAA